MDSYDAIVCTALEGPDGLQLRKMTRAPLRPDQARLRVLASGINFPDLLMTRGEYQFRPDPPFTPGLEVAGEVIEVGPHATVAVGARVCASASQGGYASEMTVAGAALKAWPAGFSAAEAAGFYVTAATAWHGLVDRGGAKAGERLLVLGAGGGVGLAAVQLGRALGLEVVAAARNPDRLRAASEAGATKLVQLDAPLREGIEALFGKRPIDIVFDPVGGPLAAEAAGCLAWGGRYLIIGFASGTIPTLTFNRLLLAGYGVLGVRAGEHARRHADEASRSITALLQTSATYDLRPRIGLQAPLCRARDALRALEAGEVCGKAVLLAD
jgi:NADPH2:quinone reductase